LLLGAALVGDIGIESNETTGGEGAAAELQGAAVGTAAFDGASGDAGLDELDAAADLGFDIDSTEFAGAGLQAEDVFHVHADGENFGRNADAFWEVLVPFDEAEVGVADHQAVWHAGEGCLPLCGFVFR